MLVEVDPDGSTFKTLLVGDARNGLEEALEVLHVMTRKKIYEKVSETLEENSVIESGENVIEGSLEW